MAHLHNCIIRGINCIYLQAPNVHAADDVKDFLFFTRAWCSFVHHHHQIEEDLVFPRLEAYTGKAGCMSANIEQHHLFEPGLKQLTEYATKTPVGDFDSVKLRALIDGFATALQTHLEAEISTLLDLQSYESKGLMEIFKESEAAGFNQPNVCAPTSFYEQLSNISRTKHCH
jgi:hemerythrin-like domain-containing protein